MAEAEIEGEEPADPAQVAHEQRQIEAVLRSKRGQRIGPRIGAEHDQRRIARQHLDHGEDDHRGQRERDQGGGEAPGEELKHEMSSRAPRGIFGATGKIPRDARDDSLR